MQPPPVEPPAADPNGASRTTAGWAGLVRQTVGREEIRYLLVAGTTTLVYLAVLALALATGMPYMVAILIAQALIIGAAFPVYRTVIFRSTGRWQADLPRFVGVWGGGFVAGLVVTPALVELAHVPPFPAQVVAVAGVAILSYLGHKFVSFRH